MYTVEKLLFKAWWKMDETDKFTLAELFARYHSVKGAEQRARIVGFVNDKAVVIHEYANGELVY